ncbi:hypothetical protein GCM10020331_098480 [Ectobacillus funiculus]
MGQQILANEESTADFSNKNSKKTNLLTLILQTRSQVGNSIIPRIYIEEEHEFPSMDVAGIVLLKNKMIGYLPPGNIEGLQIIRNEYRGGMLQILPCQTQPEKSK